MAKQKTTGKVKSERSRKSGNSRGASQRRNTTPMWSPGDTPF